MRPLTKRMRLLSIVAAAGLTLGLVGTAAAVTSRHSPAAPYKACSNAKKVLSVEVHGKCPAGTVLVKLGAKGAPGAKGAAGANGAAGPAGARGATGASGTLSNNTGLTVAGPLVVTGASTLAGVSATGIADSGSLSATGFADSGALSATGITDKGTTNLANVVDSGPLSAVGVADSGTLSAVAITDSGTLGVTGLATLNGGFANPTNSVTTPSLTSGTAVQNTGPDSSYMVTLTGGTSGMFTVAIGANSSASDVIASAVQLLAGTGTIVNVTVPRTWYIEVTVGGSATITNTTVVQL